MKISIVKFINKKIFFSQQLMVPLYIVFLITTATNTSAQQVSKYLDAKLSTEERVNDIVARLSLEQKIKLLQYRGTAIKTNGLDIPAYNWWNECLHGVARAGKATVFPQAIGFAATWDTALIQKVADAISDEARAKHEFFAKKNKRGIYQGLNFWTPNINIFRDPRWGRGMETYGEDPWLTGKIASAFVRGLQGSNPRYFKTIATVKHFAVHSGPESSRHRYNAQVSDRDLYTTYTPAFKMAVQQAGVYSLMCAYNRFRDKPCCGSDFLLTDLLRNQWGFKGFIVTDCGAVDDFFATGAHGVATTPEAAAAMAIKAGVDLECGEVFNALGKAIKMKLITEQDLDICIKRLFTARFKLGFFDAASTMPFSNIPYSVVENQAHKNLALEAARKSIVLLKNNAFAPNQNVTVLPLKKSIKTVAVIGPNANDEEVLLANYNGYPTHVVTPFEGIRNKLPNAKVLYAKGCTHVDGLPTVDVIPAAFLFKNETGTVPGLTTHYFGNSKFEGKAIFSGTDKNIDFSWINKPPYPSMDEENFSVIWDGFLKAPETGEAILDIIGSNQFDLMIDGKSLLTFNSEHHAEHKYATIDFVKDRLYKVQIKFASYGANAQIKLNWQLPNFDFKAEAVKIAKRADVVVMCMGLSPRIEGEEMKIKLPGFSGGDRTVLKLPEVQENLIREIAALGKPVVLVLINGSALAINWEKENLPAIVESWYGGQQAGTAIADVLFGDYNPSGKLPVTFYTSENELPDFENYDMTGRTYRYYKGQPLFSFGYGLSYSQFSYSNLKVAKTGSVKRPVTISATVQNTGSKDGEEVVQLYVENIASAYPVPLKSLKGFKRIGLKKGERQTIQFTLAPDDFSVIDNDGKAIVETGNYKISIGGGQPFTAGNKMGNSNVVTEIIKLQ